MDLRKFDISSINHKSICVFVGNNNANMTQSLLDLLYNKIDIPLTHIVVPNSNNKNIFSRHLNKSFIHNEIGNLPYNMLHAQVSDEKNKAHLILDNCITESTFNEHSIGEIVMNIYHYNMNLTITTNSNLDIPQVFANCIDYTFIFQDASINNRRNIYRRYCDIIPSFSIFCDLMNMLEEDECLVVHNSSQSIHLERQVKWYKPNDNGDFKMITLDNAMINDIVNKLSHMKIDF